jgi:hypothetical protein
MYQATRDYQITVTQDSVFMYDLNRVEPVTSYSLDDSTNQLVNDILNDNL